MMRSLVALVLACVSAITLAAAPADSNYVLGKDDVIRVTVYDHADMTTEAQINNEGTISFPLVGKVKVEGLSASGVENAITNALRAGGYIKNPNVNVAVVTYKSQKISILGQVTRPGLYTLDGGTSLQQALATAGGVAGTGGERVVLIRGNTRTEYRLTDYLLTGNTVLVQAGDVIFVPQLEQVYVMGEVNRPGVFRLDNGMTVMQAIAAAGGFTLRADDDDLTVTREVEGKPTVYRIRSTDRLQAADVIVVGESLF